MSLERDGMGNVTEIVCKEQISRNLLATKNWSEERYGQSLEEGPMGQSESGARADADQVEIFTHVKREGNRNLSGTKRC